MTERLRLIGHGEILREINIYVKKKRIKQTEIIQSKIILLNTLS